jgi:hypothetical protein
MISLLVLPWLLLPVLAYTPTAPEILNRMEAVLGRAKPVQVQVVRENPGGKILEEKTETIPADGLEAAASSYLDVPYALFTGSKESLADAWPFLTMEETPVLLDRISGTVCYLLEGDSVRLWIDKGTFTPLRIEIRTPSPDSLTGSSLRVTDYLEMIHISEKVRYPARTEVHQDDTLLIVERIIPAAAGSEEP